MCVHSHTFLFKQCKSLMIYRSSVNCRFWLLIVCLWKCLSFSLSLSLSFCLSFSLSYSVCWWNRKQKKICNSFFKHKTISYFLLFFFHFLFYFFLLKCFFFISSLKVFFPLVCCCCCLLSCLWVWKKEWKLMSKNL